MTRALFALIRKEDSNIRRFFNYVIVRHDVSIAAEAAQAGIQRGDIILGVNGQPIHESRDLQLKLNTMSPGSQVTMKLFRNGSEKEVRATLGEAPAQKAAPVENQPPSSADTLDGVTVHDLTAPIAHKIGVPASTQGVVIMNVRMGSLAGDAGLQSGDVIQEVNRKPVKNAAEFESAARLAGTPRLFSW